MTPKRIIFTGGSGEAGRVCVEYLVKQGHQILNLDVRPLDLPGVHTIITDLTNLGEVYSAFSHTLFSRNEYHKTPLQFPPVDAVIHFAAFPRPLTVPDSRLFSDNVTMSYNVCEAASKLGIKKVVLASSLSIYGSAYTQNEVVWDEFPVLEDSYDVNPTDSYALSKVCSEKIGRSFATRFGIDVYALRPCFVVIPGNFTEGLRPMLENDAINHKVGFCYTAAEDLGQICHRCVLTNGLGFQIFNAVNDRALCKEPITDLIQRVAPNTKITRELRDDESPVSNYKARLMLGFKEEHDYEKEMAKEMKQEDLDGD